MQPDWSDMRRILLLWHWLRIRKFKNRIINYFRLPANSDYHFEYRTPVQRGQTTKNVQTLAMNRQLTVAPYRNVSIKMKSMNTTGRKAWQTTLIPLRSFFACASTSLPKWASTGAINKIWASTKFLTCETAVLAQVSIKSRHLLRYQTKKNSTTWVIRCTVRSALLTPTVSRSLGTLFQSRSQTSTACATITPLPVSWRVKRMSAPRSLTLWVSVKVRLTRSFTLRKSKSLQDSLTAPIWSQSQSITSTDLVKLLGALVLSNMFFLQINRFQQQNWLALQVQQTRPTLVATY